MRTLFFLVLIAGCGGAHKTAAEQCMDGAASVDGVPCCANFFSTSNARCTEGDQCIGEPGGSCICESSVWVCGDPPRRPDLAATSTD